MSDDFDLHAVNDYPPERVAHDAEIELRAVLDCINHFDMSYTDKEILSDAAEILRRCANGNY